MVTSYQTWQGLAIQPAGIQNGLAAGDTAAASGVTAADMTADFRARLAALSSANLGRRPVVSS